MFCLLTHGTSSFSRVGVHGASGRDPQLLSEVVPDCVPQEGDTLPGVSLGLGAECLNHVAVRRPRHCPPRGFSSFTVGQQPPGPRVCGPRVRGPGARGPVRVRGQVCCALRRSFSAVGARRGWVCSAWGLFGAQGKARKGLCFHPWTLDHHWDSGPWSFLQAFILFTNVIPGAET